MTIKTSVSEETQYNNFCLNAANDDFIFSTFKINSTYNQILEHVDKNTGNDYYETVKQYYPESLERIKQIQINDIYGSPKIENYAFGNYSPSSLRYFKVASELNHCFSNIKNFNILEIGGGYGGQSLISKMIHGYKSWTMVDLPNVVKLQKKYLSKFHFDEITSFSYLDNSYLNKKYDLIVSNYAFSECELLIQLDYINKVMLNNEKIYMTINFFPNLNSLSINNLKELLNIQVYEEIPNTCATNKIIMKLNNKQPYTVD